MPWREEKKIHEIFQDLGVAAEVDNARTKGFLERYFVRGKFPEKTVN